MNPEQREAVEYTEGPTLILAGAGSGKTRVLTYKIAHLVEQGMQPWRILAVTFTNKAAREMADRVEHLLDMSAKTLWIGTFHGICARIMRREAQRWGFPSDFTIYDRDDQLTIVKRALKELGAPADKGAPSRVLSVIGMVKSQNIPVNRLNEFITGPDANFQIKVYERYCSLMKEAGAFDFDDLLLVPVVKFQEHPDSLFDWKRRFSYILVDEYQDTNRLQYLFMKLLSADHGLVTVVGDDDQSIYSWRGADIENILGFEKDFKHVRTVRLEKNYRSTGNILAAANGVVANNKYRMTKKLWTDSPGGEKIKIIECRDDREEAEKVISTIEKEREEHTLRLRDFVVLYRTNSQSRTFEDVLRRRGLPYVIVGGLRFYERKEIKDILAYLRLAVNPADIVSFQRAINTPKRGIGPKSIERLQQYASMNGISVIRACLEADRILGPSIGHKAQQFGEIIKTVTDRHADGNLDELAQHIIEKSGYESYLFGEFPDNADERLDNINELITAIGEYRNPAGEVNLGDFLAEVALVADVDAWDETSDAVTMMTLHSAKGLEFPSVFIAGVEYGLFPLQRAMESDRELEEERRLFYVGITRARQLLHITYAVQRMRYGSFSGGASMFVNELPQEVAEFEASRPARQASLFETRRDSKPQDRRVTRPMEFEDYVQEMPDYESGSGGMYAVGSYVIHPKFGRGKITETSGSGDGLTLTIMFGATRKKILAKYGKLRSV